MTLYYREQAAGHHTDLVAEVGNIHDGSLGECHALIEAIADAGADAVKFQAHFADAESSPDEQFPARFPFHPQDKTRQDYWRRMQFGVHEWFGLCAHAHECGLEFIVSPFSLHAVRTLDHLSDRWKIASGEADNIALIRAIRDTGKRVILSTGMSTTAEMNIAAGELCRVDDPGHVTVLQCTTQYPCPPDMIGLNLAWQNARNICFRGGLSDHSGTIYPGIVGAYLGLHMVEVHVCWDKRQFGVDALSSLTIGELRQLADGMRFAEEMRRCPVGKDEMAARLTDAACYRAGKQRPEVDKYAARD